MNDLRVGSPSLRSPTRPWLRPLVLGLALLGSGCGSPEPAWNVLVVTFDTTRADHLACYGHPTAQTPVLDQLAAEGVLFEQARAHVPITLPSHSSLLTGKVPFTHGVRDNGLFVLGDEQETLAEMLRAAGHRTAAAIASFPLIERFGIGQGFELFDDHVTARYEDLLGERSLPKDRFFFDERRAARVNEAIFPWLEEHHQEPFFLWVHYFDPHHPHEPPPPWDQRFAHDLYLGEIAYADESLGTLLDTLRRLGVYDRTLIVFTSDHGEGNGEHNESTHSLLVYDSTLHVPLIVKLPKVLQSTASVGSRVAARVGLVDVVPTVLDLLGIDPPEDLQGRSLRPWLEGGEDPENERRRLYAETLSPRLSHDWGELRTVFAGPYKYIHGPRPELYDLSQDPDELDDLLADQPDLAESLRGDLARYLDEHAVRGLDASVEVDEATARRLQALGYLQSAGDRVGPIDERLRADGDPPQDHAGTISAFSHVKNMLFQGRPVEAREYLHALLRSDPDNSHYLDLLATAESQLGRDDEALAIYDRLIREERAYPPAEKTLASAGDLLLRRGDLEGAYDRFRRAEAVAESARGQFRLAKIHQSRGEVLDARRFLERALELDPAFVPARLDLAVSDAMAGDLDAADQHFRRALDDHPYNPRAFYNYGTFLIQSQREDEALAYFRRAAELQPNYPKALYALVELETLTGGLEAARQHLAALERFAPLSQETRMARELLAMPDEDGTGQPADTAREESSP